MDARTNFHDGYERLVCFESGSITLIYPGHGLEKML